MKYFPPSTPLISASNSGYTIIEVLIALAIFSIGMLAMAALQSASLMATGGVTSKTEAWEILNGQVETLKAMPFYASPGPPPFVFAPDLTVGNHNLNTPDGRYTITWQVADNVPLPAVVVPPPTATSPVITITRAVNVTIPNGTYTVSKTISAQVTRLGGNPQTQALAMVQFVKTWAASGIP
jgi:prepilin-type N-terminal cleavage/methylation domain-containing protein